jgi:hypothetical protein
MNRYRIFFVLAVLLALFVAMTCEESLPPYNEPSQVYEMRLSSSQAGLNLVIRDTLAVVRGKGNIDFIISLKNVYEETLQDTLKYQIGSLDIWWEKKPHIKQILPITIRNEIYTEEIGFWGDICMDPGDSIRLVVSWDWVDDLDNHLWEYLSPKLVGDVKEYVPMDLKVQATIQLFEHTAIVYSDILDVRIKFIILNF